jgi:two-component system, OmpR family, sensor histidine kinase KdpD
MLRKPISVATSKIAAGIAAAVLITLAAYRLHFNLSAATSVHLFLVVTIALRWGFLEASLVSVCSVACLDYFFTDPLFQFYIADSHDWVALGAFESVALVVARLSALVNRHAQDAEVHRAQLQKLYDLSQSILLVDRHQPVEAQLADLLLSTLQARGVVLWNAPDSRICRRGECSVTDDEVRSLHFTDNSRDEPGISGRVLRAGVRPIGSILICGHSLDEASISAAASLTAVAMERARSLAGETSAEAARQSEQLRSAVLDGLAHAFKSPLTAILASSSGLLAMNSLSGAEKKLVSLIDERAGHLSELTTRLLRTAKLESGELKLRREPINLAQLIQNSVTASAQDLSPHSVEFRPVNQYGLVRGDKQLLQMALFQLLDNAAKYGKIGSSIIVDLEEREAEVLVRVRNEGSFIPLDERDKVFQRFYRSPETAGSIAGTGIGLSFVKRITEAHQGRTWVNSDLESGTTFVISLPRSVDGL